MDELDGRVCLPSTNQAPTQTSLSVLFQSPFCVDFFPLFLRSLSPFSSFIFPLLSPPCPFTHLPFPPLQPLHRHLLFSFLTTFIHRHFLTNNNTYTHHHHPHLGATTPHPLFSQQQQQKRSIDSRALFSPPTYGNKLFTLDSCFDPFSSLSSLSSYLRMTYATHPLRRLPSTTL